MENTLIDNIAESITGNILSSKIIDKEVVKLNIKIALTALAPQQNSYPKNGNGVNIIQGNKNTLFENMKEKLHQRKLQARKDSYEKNYWKNIVSQLIDEETMNEHYEIIKLESEKILGNDNQGE